MHHLLAQITSDNVLDTVTKIGWPGIVLLIVTRWLERIEHTVKGLSMALWMDLASRPHTDPYVKKTADREIARMEAKEKSRVP